MDWRDEHNLKVCGENIRDKGIRIETCRYPMHLKILRDELTQNILWLNTFIRKLEQEEAS